MHCGGAHAPTQGGYVRLATNVVREVKLPQVRSATRELYVVRGAALSNDRVRPCKRWLLSRKTRPTNGSDATPVVTVFEHCASLTIRSQLASARRCAMQP